MPEIDREQLERKDKADLKREAQHRTSGPARQRTPTNQNPVIGRLVDEGKVKPVHPGELEENAELTEAAAKRGAEAAKAEAEAAGPVVVAGEGDKA